MNSLGLILSKDFYNILKYILKIFLEVDVIDYEEMWKSCSHQEDDYNCEIIIFSLLDYLYTNGYSDSWCSVLATQFRIKWLCWLIEYDESLGEFIESSQSKIFSSFNSYVKDL